jgi:N-acetylmuramoyl-L-alanine amidase
VTGFTRRGATTVYLERAAGSVVIAAAGAAADTLALGRETSAEVAGFCVDSRDGRAVGGAWLSDGDGPPALANRDGYFAVADSAESLRVMRAGYRVRVVPASARVTLEPVADGRLHGVRFALDPEGGGDEPAGLGPTSLRAADINLRVAIALRAMLEAAGAAVVLTRDDDAPASGLERVLRAEEFDPARYVRIAHRGRPGEPGVAVGHYPGSREGERLARDLASALGGPARVIEDPQYVLQQTSVPAVCANLAPISDRDTERSLLSAATIREEAYSLYLGLLAHFGAPSGGQIEARIAAGRAPEDAVVSLDGHLHLVPGPDGTLRFRRVEPGRHRIEAAFAGGPRWVRDITVTEGSPPVVSFGVARPEDPAHNR